MLLLLHERVGWADMPFSCSGGPLFYLGHSPPSPCGDGRHQRLFTKRPPGRCRCVPQRRVVATDSTGARLLLSRTSPNGSVACGGDWHCRCAPPGVAGESE